MLESPHRMNSIAILGAGELGATLARLTAEAEIARRVILLDADEGKARGKALDLAQSGPIEGYDTQVEGGARLAPGDAHDVVVIADPPELVDVSAEAARGYGHRLVPFVGDGLLVVSGCFGPTIVEAAVEKGLARERVLGSAPLAWAAAFDGDWRTSYGCEPRTSRSPFSACPPRTSSCPSAPPRWAACPSTRSRRSPLVGRSRRSVAVGSGPSPWRPRPCMS